MWLHYFFISLRKNKRSLKISITNTWLVLDSYAMNICSTRSIPERSRGPWKFQAPIDISVCVSADNRLLLENTGPFIHN